MRTLTFFLLCIAVQLSFAQSDLEIIKVKNPDKSVSISVKNNGDIEYQVVIDFDLEGMKSDANLPITKTIMPETTEQVTILRPIGKGKTTYTINLKTPESDALSNSTDNGGGITIYTKNSHKRSTQLAIYLEQNGIDYNQVNTSYDPESMQVFKNMLIAYNLEEVRYKMPVVVYKGEVFYNIKNVKKFCRENFSDEGKFVKKSERRY